MYRTIVAVLVIGLISAAAFAGYLVAQYRLPPYTLVRSIEQPMRDYYRGLFPDRGSAVPSAALESIFIPLKSQSVEVPVARKGDGGAVGSFGDDVILLTHEGGLFAATSASDLTVLDIEPPENGFDDYAAFAASDPGAEFKHELGYLRYNAIIEYATASERGLAISYTEYNPTENCFLTAVALLPIDAGDNIRMVSTAAADWRVVFRTEPCLPLKAMFNAIEGHMAGGRLAARSPSLLYLGSGDYHWDGVFAPEALSQNPDNSYGKVIEIDLASGASRQVSKGHRNMQGVTTDQQGRIWVVEHGVRGGDELNLVREGGDYGWPTQTLGTSYDKTPWPMASSYGRHDLFEPPVFAWLPSVATSSLTLVDGFHKSWDGDLLVGSLRDQSLHRVRITGDRLMFAERIPIGERIRDVHQHNDGRIVFWTDRKTLHFLEPADSRYRSEFVDQHIAALDYDEADRARVAAAVTACMECHDFGSVGGAGAPALGAVYEADLGDGGFSNYSDAFRNASGIWTRERLLAFIDDPQSVVPGTSMPEPSIGDAFVAEELVNLLEAIKNSE